MSRDLRTQTAIVTGSSKGIGYAIAEALVDLGVSVVITARNEAEIERAISRLKERGGGRVLGVPCDVRSHASVRSLVAHAASELGGLDILVNNAGVGAFGSVEEMSPEMWDTVLETNLSGVFYACHEAIPHMRQRGGGWIINIGSLAGKNAFAGGAAYNASKFGLVGFSEALMLDVREHDIRVCYVMPGSVATQFSGPSGSHGRGDTEWMLQPEDIAEVVTDLLRYPERALPSRVEIRPSRPRKK
jgi:NAD(P)-dependent dehydrogenase (short-subunit alcohol dehydrogenase family)